MYLRSFVENLSFTLRNEEGGSEQIRAGASNLKKPPIDNVERFLSMLGFDSTGKVKTLNVL
jgi:hypothetical protein